MSLGYRVTNLSSRAASGCSTGRSRASKESSWPLLNLSIDWMKSIALERFFHLFFLAVAKKEVELRRQPRWIRLKYCMDADAH